MAILRLNYKQLKHHGKRLLCMFCRQCFITQEILDKDKRVCIEINGK